MALRPLAWRSQWSVCLVMLGPRLSERSCCCCLQGSMQGRVLTSALPGLSILPSCWQGKCHGQLGTVGWRSRIWGSMQKARGKGAEKGTGMCAAMLGHKTVLPQQDTMRKDLKISPELFSSPTVLQILGRSTSPNFKKPLWL